MFIYWMLYILLEILYHNIANKMYNIQGIETTS